MPTIDEALQIALDHHRAGRLTEAEDVYSRILQVAPKHPDVLYNQGFAQQMQGKLAEAIASYRRLLHVVPGFAAGHAKLGEVHLWLGRLGAALDHYRDALALEPGNDATQQSLKQIQDYANTRQSCLEHQRTKGRLDLRDVTFLIPFRLDTDDRRRNIKIIVAYLLKHFDTNILIGEDQPGTSHFKTIADEMGVPDGACRLIHITGNDTSFTHRGKQINILAEAARTPIVVGYDTDVIVDPVQYLYGRAAIQAGALMACPFNGLFFDVGVDIVPAVERSLSVAPIDLLDARNPLLYKNSYSGAVFFDRARFLELGGFNENFISWGWEDFELYQRFVKLGERIERLWGPLYHLSHARSPNSLKVHPFYEANVTEYNRVMAMSKDDILAAIASGAFKRPYVSSADLPPMEPA